MVCEVCFLVRFVSFLFLTLDAPSVDCFGGLKFYMVCYTIGWVRDKVPELKQWQAAWAKRASSREPQSEFAPYDSPWERPCFKLKNKENAVTWKSKQRLAFNVWNAERGVDNYWTASVQGFARLIDSFTLYLLTYRLSLQMIGWLIERVLGWSIPGYFLLFSCHRSFWRWGHAIFGGSRGSRKRRSNGKVYQRNKGFCHVFWIRLSVVPFSFNLECQ